MARALALAALLAAGCYSPDLTDGQYSCQSGLCPDGYDCTTSCKLCVHHGAPLDDSARCSSDGGGPVGGCTAFGGVRADGDPGMAKVAFCYAAWDIPGVDVKRDAGVLQPKCGRLPDLQSPPGHGCTVEDNCAPGWHVCASLVDATSAGLSCGVAPTGFWVTHQLVGALGDCASDAPVAPVGCGENVSYPVRQLLGCQPFDAALSLMSCGGSNGVWSCTMDLPSGATAATTLTKPPVRQDGVICCSG
jgi:hypothetical protein